MIRDGNATAAWLANDFNASRRHALIVAQIIKLSVVFASQYRKKQWHMYCRPDTAKAPLGHKTLPE